MSLPSSLAYVFFPFAIWDDFLSVIDSLSFFFLFSFFFSDFSLTELFSTFRFVFVDVSVHSSNVVLSSLSCELSEEDSKLSRFFKRNDSDPGQWHNGWEGGCGVGTRTTVTEREQLEEEEEEVEKKEEEEKDKVEKEEEEEKEEEDKEDDRSSWKEEEAAGLSSSGNSLGFE